MTRRVVLTGMGAVTPLGSDLKSSCQALGEGRTAVGPAESLRETAWNERCVAEVKQFDPRSYFRFPKLLKVADRKTRFAVAAAVMALEDSALPENDVVLDGLGVCVGVGGSDLQLEDIARAIASTEEPEPITEIPFFSRQILSGLNPLWLLLNLPNMVSAHVAIQVQARGPNNTVMTDWAAGSQAVAEAFCWIGNGEASAVLAGGADSGVFPLCMASYFQESTVDRPGADRHESFAMGEGSAMVVLEEREHALRRGARIYGEVVSFGAFGMPLSNGEADGGALAASLRRALQDADWNPADLHRIGLASAPGTEHRRIEMEALRQVFGCGAEDLPLFDAKSKIGHMLSASGAVELALMLESMPRNTGPARVLSSSLGLLGQAVTLAVSLQES